MTTTSQPLTFGELLEKKLRIRLEGKDYSIRTSKNKWHTTVVVSPKEKGRALLRNAEWANPTC